MKYNFDEMIDRHHTDSQKWGVDDNELSMGIADMDFRVAPVVMDAIKNKAELGIYGYADVPDAYYQSFQEWWSKYHQFDMDTSWMVFSTGVVPAISSIVRKMTTPAENVLIQAPVYNIFYNSILNNGRRVLSSDLVYENGQYSIDFEDLEEKLSNTQTTMMILCNPHNPVGKIWTKEELARIGELCKRHHVLVVSDEVHCDIVEPGQSYIPFASVNETCRNNSITCLAASKTFNLAGLQTACIVVPNEAVRNRVIRGLNTDEVAEPNVFAIDGVIAALTKGRDWSEQVNAYIQTNKEIAKEFFEKELPQLHLVDSKASYLLWVDCIRIAPNTVPFVEFIKEKTGLCISSGEIFGDCGASFVRINIACPKERMLDGLNRLKKGVKLYETLDNA